MQDRLRELQTLLNTEIPITRHFNLTVGAYDERILRLDAPLAENVNHAGTAFGGSLSALLTLAGWSMTWFMLQEYNLTGEIIIQDSNCRYLAPVKKDFSAYCYRPSNEQLGRFEKMLRTHKKGRLELKAEILEGDTLAVSFVGRYVVRLA
ncbi:YiiD C-terminal domain-containing protein [Dictyobacter formicarum]|nr:YiiD C-terminal domain-containing protein [Dictyobacter formicarum]